MPRSVLSDYHLSLTDFSSEDSALRKVFENRLPHFFANRDKCFNEIVHSKWKSYGAQRWECDINR